MKETRAYKAGVVQGKSIIENVNLFYQNRTAIKYMVGLMSVLIPEFKRRKK